ncbi:MAG: hypothetical protein AB7F75_11995 [Planctomycetota bacterium]
MLPALMVLVLSTVLGSESDALEQEARAKLGDIRGLVITPHQGGLVLRGRLLTPDDARRVAEVSRQDPRIENRTRLDEAFHHGVLAAMISHHLDAVSCKTRIEGRRVILEGTAPGVAEAEEAVKIAKARLPGEDWEIVNLLRVEPLMVNVNLTFIQVNRTALERSGVNLLKSLDATLQGQFGDGGPDRSLVAGATARLHELIGKGWGDLVAEPRICVQSGKTGIFQDGGRRVIPGTGDSPHHELDWGLILKVTPQAKSTGDVILAVELEVSAPMSAGSQDFTRFRTQTEVTAKLGQTLVLSELRRSLQGVFREKTPVLGDIPLLKSLFSEDGEDAQQRDLVVFITPEVPKVDESARAATGRFQTLRELVRNSR